MKIINSEDHNFDSLKENFNLIIDQNFPLHSKGNLKYQKEYFKSNELICKISFIFINSGIAKFLFLGDVFKTDKISIFGLPSLSIELVNLNNIEKKFIENHLTKDLQISNFKIDHLELINSNRISFFSNYLLKKGFKNNLMVNSIVDLNYDYDYLKMCYRKSYKSLINKYNKDFNLIVLERESNNEDLFSEFKDLHFIDAGKKTRSDRTWEIQFELINEGLAVVFLLEKDKKIVSGAYFTNNNKTAYYGVSASDPSSKKQFPLTHVIIDNAIKYFKKKNLEKIILGNYETNKNNTKEYNISLFKCGFSDIKEYQINISN